MERDICPICNRKVLIHMYALTCDLCYHPVHRNCSLFSCNEYNEFIKNGRRDWTCRICLESVFPFNHMVNDTVFHNVLVEFANDYCLLDPWFIQAKIFDPFSLNDEKEYLPCTDIDPDSCYYNELSFCIQMNGNYYDEASFNRSLQKVGIGNDLFSLMHLNKRSIPSNISKLTQYLSILNVYFDIIGHQKHSLLK